MSQTRIFIIDDHPEFARRVAEFLSEHDSFRVTGSAKSGKEGLEALKEKPCEVVLVDVVLPDMRGFDVVRKLRQEGDQSRIIMMSVHDSQPYRDSALEAGANAFIAKNDFANTIFDTITEITA